MVAASSSRELLAAALILLVAVFAPSSHEHAIFYRIMYSLIAIAALFLASVFNDFYQEKEGNKKSHPKANKTKQNNLFDVEVIKVELPTKLPDTVYNTAIRMDQYLESFQLSRHSEVKLTEQGFQISQGNKRLRARVLPGNAVGWEQGGTVWEQGRSDWMSAVWVAPRAAEVVEIGWLGLGGTAIRADETASADVSAPVETTTTPTFNLSDVIQVAGVQSKPELNGRIGVIVKAVNDTGRYGVRLDGGKDAISLHGRNLQDAPQIDMKGVSLAALRSFRSAFSSLLGDELTVEEAVHGLIQPLTGAHCCSLASALSSCEAVDEAGRPMAAPATIYVVATPGDTVTRAIEAVESYVIQKESPEDIYVWFPLLSLNYHEPPLTDRPMSWWNSALPAGLKKVGQVALMLHPVVEPTVLSRPWCMYELYTAAITSECKLQIMCAPSELEKLAEALLKNMDGVISTWDRIAESDWKKAEALGATDQQRAAIEKHIEKGQSEKGLSGMDFSEALTTAMHKWLLQHARKALLSLPKEERGTSTLLDGVVKLLQQHGDFENAEPLAREQVEARKSKFGNRKVETLDAVANLSILLHQLGKLDEAEPFSRDKLDGYREIHGDYHPDTVTALDTHSQLLSDMRKLEEALPLKREALRVKRKVLGMRHPDTLLSVNNLAVLLNDLGQQTGNTAMLREAEPLKREALAGCREVLGNRHPHTLASISNLADMLIQIGHIDPRAYYEAESLCREALAGSREVLGAGHPDTFKAAGNLAALLVEMARLHTPKSEEEVKYLKEAEPLFANVCAGFSAGLGKTHPSTLAYISERARTLVELGRAEDAVALLEESVASSRAALGDGHPETLVGITHLAGTYRSQENLEKAEMLMREVIKGWNEIEEKDTVKRHSVTATNIMAEILHAQGKNQEAEPLCRQVLSDFLQAVGPEHPFTRSAAGNLVGVLRARGGGEEEVARLTENFKLDEKPNEEQAP